MASVSVVYAFSPLSASGTNEDGASPTSLICAPNGDLIGTARAGGPHGGGTVFQITPAGDFSILYSFSGLRSLENTNADGAAPLAALVRGKDGRYYGVTSAGGDAGEGTAFALETSGKLTTLYSFSATEGLVNSNPDGAQPSAPFLLGKDGNLYGAASIGGDGGEGTIFRISPEGKFERLYAFGLSTDMQTNPDGGQPLGALVQGPDGILYGTTAAFGPGGAGTIYKIAPDAEFAVVHAFMQLDDNRENPDGAAPSVGLTAAGDGSFYGTTLLGGRRGTGTIFRVWPDGRFAQLYVFSAIKGRRLSNADGANPQGMLLLASDGNLYGTTRGGGEGGTGTIFRVTLEGEFETLYTFRALARDGTNLDGANPCGPLVEGANGDLYGTAAAGGPKGAGVVYEVHLSLRKTD